MSRKNNLERRRQHHAAMLKDAAKHEALAKKRRDRRVALKEKKAADQELSAALDKLATTEDKKVDSEVPKLGATLRISKAKDVKMGLAAVGEGRISKRQKNAKARYRSRKIKERMLARQALLMND